MSSTFSVFGASAIFALEFRKLETAKYVSLFLYIYTHIYIFRMLTAQRRFMLIQFEIFNVKADAF